MGSRGVPADKVNLRLILVSGRTKEFLFTHSSSAADITEHVYSNWPTEWSEEKLPETNILRLIYQGRFLHGNVTLGDYKQTVEIWTRQHGLDLRWSQSLFDIYLSALQLPTGKTTVMHLVARENLPEPNNQGQLKKDKSGEASCSLCCVLL